MSRTFYSLEDLQIFLFFFLAPIKIPITILFFCLFYCLVSILPFFRRYFKNNRKFKNWALSVCRPIMRMFLFGLGIIKINVEGKLDYDTRTIVSNHLSLIETVVILYLFPVSYLAAANLEENSIVRKTSKVFEIIFVDRSKKNSNVTEQLKNIANDPSLLPVFVFPEGKVTNGDAMVGFRSGAYVSNTPVQALAIRFRLWFCPRNMSTVSWLEDDWWYYCYTVYTIPFMTMDIKVLDPINWKGSSKEPDQKAAESQLQIANALHTKAFAMTNKVLFQKAKQE